MKTIPVRIHCDCRASLHPIRASLSGLTTVTRKCRTCKRHWSITLECVKNIDGELCVHVATLVELK